MTEQSRALEIIEAQLDILEEEPANLTEADLARMREADARLSNLAALLSLRYQPPTALTTVTVKKPERPYPDDFNFGISGLNLP